VRSPARPANATTFQDAQYRRLRDAAEATNRARVDAWRAEAARRLRPWQAQVLSQLQDLSRRLDGAAAQSMGDGVAAAVQSAVNTLTGLPGRRVLLLLAGARIRSAADVTLDRSPAGIHLVAANVPDAGASMLTGAAGPGMTVTALGAALTELELAAAVNG
jgi:hypothetical protein